jgi:two-component system sensor kinase FixL
MVDDDRRAGEVTRRLHSFVKRGEVELQPLDLNLVIQEVVRLLSNDAVLRNVDIVLELDPTLPPVLGDRVQVQQVVLNLMLNGCEAMGEVTTDDRRLVVRTQRTGADSVQATVQDCGPGMG